MNPDTLLQLVYLLSATLFVFGLKRLGSPATARQGNRMAALAMLIAIVATLVEQEILNWQLIALGIILGSLAGAIAARTVRMTDMPQMVGIFNGLGGGASGVVAAAEFFRLGGGDLGVEAGVTILLSTLIGTVTLSGSFIAFGKLQRFISGAPLTFPFSRTLNAVLFVAILVIAAMQVTGGATVTMYLVLTGLALVLGILLVSPIGGADMPVVISLLNSYSGLAASAAGFVLGNMILIISGALVGAAGLILTNLMCKAMNRSLANVAFGAFGAADSTGGRITPGEGKTVRDVDAEQAAMVLAYAQSVIVVPGYGLAVAQAQHDIRKLSDLLQERGVTVKFAIHPVAGRMPGHMNVLLAEADVPYTQLFDLDEINDEFSTTDVALIVGANDVVNPDARDPSSVIAGMPILDVDRARNVIVMKRSLSPGFAGIDNPLFYLDRTMMFFGDAKGSMVDLVRETKEV
ncbi:MAG: NAD(P)(+) transhydrogenase (Re/Si-specific) subunit beta [Gammaproteobacteria bacterium]|nr:NAD(P)(+) transhydrogenase (Re/Si-specific) subunit beta [Gammaproteobacteria bacterium]